MPSERLSILRNFSWNLVGNVLYALSQWGMLIAISKFLDVAAVGEYTLALALTSPVIQFTNMQMRSVQVTDVEEEFAFSTYLGFRLLLTCIGFIVIITVGFWSGGEWQAYLVIVSVGLAKSFESISDIIYGLFQKHERMNFIGRSLILKSVLSFGTVVGGVALTHDLVVATVSQACSWLLLLLFYDMKNAKKFVSIKVTLAHSSTYSLLWKGVPLGLVMLMISLNTNVPRYFISHFLGTEYLGYFGALSYVVIAGNTFVLALGQSSSPRLSRYYADRSMRDYIKMTSRLCAVGGVIAIVPIAVIRLWGGTILSLVYKSSYASYSWVFFLLMISAGIGYVTSFLGYSVTAARYFRIQPVILFLTVLATFLTSLCLVPNRGLDGAAYALIAGASVQFLSTGLVYLWIVRSGYKLMSRTL